LAVKKSRPELLEALETVSESDRVSTDVSVEAQGLISKLSKPQFALMAAVTVKVLYLLAPENTMMQGKSCNMALATELISCATSEISSMRSDDSFEEFASAAGLTDQGRC
jgi:hypothetical protein